jgi:AcrR family transcriptional regulator
MKEVLVDDTPPWEAVTDEVVQRWSAADQSAKQDRSRRRQQEILDAAVTVFARDGIARARIADIATHAGVPLSSVYDYYASKEDLAYALPATRMGAFYAEFLDRARRVNTARERLSLYLWLTADFARRNPEWARILYLEIWPSVAVKDVTVQRSIDDFARILVALVRDGKQAGEWISKHDPYQSAAIFIGSVNQLLITWLLYGRPRDLMTAVSALIERLLPLLEPILPVKPRGRRSRALV